MILLLVDISYARIIKVVDIFKRETDVLMTSKELPLVLVSQLPQKKEDKDMTQRYVVFLKWGQWEKEQVTLWMRRCRSQCMRPNLGLWQHLQVETHT